MSRFGAMGDEFNIGILANILSVARPGSPMVANKDTRLRMWANIAVITPPGETPALNPGQVNGFFDADLRSTFTLEYREQGAVDFEYERGQHYGMLKVGDTHFLVEADDKDREFIYIPRMQFANEDAAWVYLRSLKKPDSKEFDLTKLEDYIVAQ